MIQLNCKRATFLINEHSWMVYKSKIPMWLKKISKITLPKPLGMPYISLYFLYINCSILRQTTALDKLDLMSLFSN